MSADRVVLGLWPIAGITTVGVTRLDAERTVQAAIDYGITAFDTAFSYGYQGESDRILGKCVHKQRERFTIIGKVGQRWNDQRERTIDGTPDALIADAQASLHRSGIEYFDTLMLHSPDPNVAIEESAEAFAHMRQRQWCRRVGICNATVDQIERFRHVTHCDAIQCPLNLLQPKSLETLIPVCRQWKCDVYVYWVLMKGLLAGAIGRNHRFALGDPRPTYDVFQGDTRRRAHRLLDHLRSVGQQYRLTVAQLSIGWALSQPGVTAALVGARCPEQIPELASSKPLAKEIIDAIQAGVP